MCPVRYELGFYISEDGTLHSHRRETLKSDMFILCTIMTEHIGTSCYYLIV
jgi:hypothetical protein